MIPVLNTERLILRPWTEDDLDAAFEMYSRWEVVRYLGKAPKVHESLEDSAAMLRRWAGFAGPLHGVWAITGPWGNRPVGAALLKELPLSDGGGGSGRTEVGWHLHPDVWGQGLATEAAGALVAHARQLDLREVVAVTYPDNLASQAVCARLGMAAMGITSDYYDLPCSLFRLDLDDRA